MKLLQFSTSHYCRKARLALSYKQIPYSVENLTPGLHRLQLKPLTGLTTVPVLLPEAEDLPTAIGDSTQIFKFLETLQPQPNLIPTDPAQRTEAWLLEDWLDESIGIAARFVYYHFRSNEGKAIDPSVASQAVIRVVRWQYSINDASVQLAIKRLDLALEVLSRWQSHPFLVGSSLSVADLAAAALLSPLALIPQYRQAHLWLFDRIAAVHYHCHEPLPPGLQGGDESKPQD